MGSKTPDRRLLNPRKNWPRGAGVYQITELSNNDTVELSDFDMGEDIDSAMIINADTGVEITQGVISLNVLEVDDVTANDTRVWVFAVGKLAP